MTEMSDIPQPDTCALFGPELEGLHDTQEIGAYLKDWHQRINTPSAVADHGTMLLAHNTALVDAVLRRLFICARGEGERRDRPCPRHRRHWRLRAQGTRPLL